MRIVTLMREAGIFVDQTSFVATPETKKHAAKLKVVNQSIPLQTDVFLGFWNKEDGFEAPFEPENSWPRDWLPKDYRHKCGINNFEVYQQACLQSGKTEVECSVPYNNMIVDPSGLVYSCHYKLYNEIDPVCHIHDFKPITPKDRICKHYGFCLSCDASHLQQKLPTKPVIVSKLYNKNELTDKEISYLSGRLKDLADSYDLLCTDKIIFESAMMYLYSGHRHSGRIAYLGDKNNVLLKYLATKKCKIYHFEENQTPEPFCDVLLMPDVSHHVNNFSNVIAKASECLKKNGILIFSLDIGDNKMRSVQELKKIIINPLLFKGFVYQNGVDFNNININDLDSQPDDSQYPYAVVVLRKVKA